MGTAGHARLGGGPTGSHPGRRDGVVVPASTGSLVCRAERGVGWEPPAPPPTPEGVSAHGPVHGPSVSAWVSHDSGDPSFQRCRSQRRPSRGDTACDPTTHPAAALGRRLGPGTARGSLSTWPPPAWRGNSYTPASPVDIFFSSQVWTDAKQELPSQCRQSCPTRGPASDAGVSWRSPRAAGLSPAPRLSTVACVPSCPDVGLSDTPRHGQWAARLLHSPSVDTGQPPHLSCCVLCLLPQGCWSAGQSIGSAGNPQHCPPPHC